MNSPELQQKTFLVLLIAVSLAFGWILWPFHGAVFWGTVLAILFAPFYRRLLVRMNQRRNLAAITTLLLCLVVVIFPMTVITTLLVQEGASFYERVSTRELDIGMYFQQILHALPDWMVKLLDRFDLSDLASLQEKLSEGVMQVSQFIAKQAVSIGQNTVGFLIRFAIMLYLLFFLLRDGTILSQRISEAMPLSMEHKRNLFSKFTTVIRATVKGNIAVAIVQGALGGMIFWFLGIKGALLWGVVMAILSLLPAVGAGLIWVPVAIYFLVTGAIWQGVTLIVFGVLVIGLVDNILRPLLVGKDTQMPDYVVLISTLGGLSLFGLNGFVIGPVIAALFIASWDIFAASKEPRRSIGKPD
ncbi:AI-2E family transporter [Noviherbaspirillum cavernae]|uniref:AI-2E family transporter n=1 Tax=Noviherbaspirillum cavernae TaxID=2320862 RepID=A0A418X2H9_9BURK|nr:AI-2E family transporter [Noviherbaspirillum cavernae]RJG06663.1 AI-2E family transporter [Noviherbaspirillum cavernae]